MTGYDNSNKGALTSLNISANQLGKNAAPAGFTRVAAEMISTDSEDDEYEHADGRRVTRRRGGKPEGVITLANSIKNNGALTSLNLTSNLLGAEGAKHVAEAIKGHVSALRYRLVAF